MPGAVKSTACQTCKLRKIKCDQNWPGCTQCTRKRLTCLGPSSLLKFVNGDQNQVKGDFPIQHAEGSGVLKLRQSRPYRLPKRNKERSGAESQSPQAGGPCCLPPRSPHQGSAKLGLGLLDAVPPAPAETVVRKPKLARHGALFCSVLGDYRRGREATEFLALPSCGKALNSLRRAIKTGQGLKIETLASIIMLERTESVFDRGRDAISLKHTEAIATMIQNIGPPKADDQLHLGLVSDSYGTLAVHFLKTGRDNFLSQDPWKGIIEDNIASLLENKEA
ncbi:hypothetical protein V2G26_015461 [Clonostachys chloroleuca]